MHSALLYVMCGYGLVLQSHKSLWSLAQYRSSLSVTMPSLITASVLMCLVSTASGVSLQSHDTLREPRTVNSDDRNVYKLVKRSTNSLSFEREAMGTELQNNGNPVFRAAIKRHDKVFLDSDINTLTFGQVMQEIYNKRQDKWDQQKKVIIDDLNELGCSPEDIPNANNVEEFYSSIIYLYTTNCVYNETNFILRNFRLHRDSLFGSYALMLNVIISQWAELEQCDTRTLYRGMGHAPQADYENMMNQSQAFAWPGFTSSSESLAVSCEFAGTNESSTIFIIDNIGNSNWKPKDIGKYSQFSNERECLYPASVMFKVTNKSIAQCPETNLTAFHIRLQHVQTPSDGSQGCTSGSCVGQGKRQSATVLVTLVAVLVSAHVQSVFVV